MKKGIFKKILKIFENFWNFWIFVAKNLNFLNFLKRKGGINGNYSVLFSADKTFLQIVISYIYILFLDIFNENEETEILVSPDSEIFSQAVGFMNERIFSSASISEIARHCRISPSGLKRIFKTRSWRCWSRICIKNERRRLCCCR